MHYRNNNPRCTSGGGAPNQCVAGEREHRAVTRVEQFNAPGGVVCIAPKKSRHPRFMLYRGAAEEGRKSGEGYVASVSLVCVRLRCDTPRIERARIHDNRIRSEPQRAMIHSTGEMIPP